MNRRTLLGRLAAGAAVVLGARAIEPTVAEAAPTEVLPTLMPGQRWTIDTPLIDLRGKSNVTISDLTIVGNTVAVAPEHLYTHSQVEQIIRQTREHADQTGWVRGFNDAGPMKMSNMADARAEGYSDGYLQATQRAESRVAEGLPIRGEDG